MHSKEMLTSPFSHNDGLVTCNMARGGGSRTVKADNSEDEAEGLIKRTDSRMLVKHLYQRHSNDFFAYLNLTLSTISMALLGRSVRSPSSLNWALGWTTAEFGQLYILLQCFNLYRVFRYHPRVFNGWFGRLALIINSWSALSIGRCVFKSLRARREFSEALMAQKIQPVAGLSSSKYSHILSLIPLFLVSRRFKPVRYIKDIRYAELEKVDPHLLNTWRRTPPKLRTISQLMARGRVSSWLSLDIIKLDGLQNAPVYIHYHGGAWIFGSKDHGPHALCQRLASRGIVVCLVNYRLSPECAWPAHIEDCKRALIYVKKHIAQFGGDPDKVFVGGESAGGHLSALIGATPNLPLYQPKEDPQADTSVAGVIPIYGIFDLCDEFGHHRAIAAKLLDVSWSVRVVASRIVLQKRYTPETKNAFNLASPTFHIRQLVDAGENPQIAPYFVPHGTDDALAAYEDAKEFYDALQKLRKRWGTWAEGETDVFATVEGGLHAFGYFPSNRAHAMGDAITDFIFHHSKRIAAAKQQAQPHPQ